jgi:hypothetical protein
MRREAFLPALCLVTASCEWAQAFDGKVTMENPNHLGQDRERYTIDHQTGPATINLRELDEVSFAASAVGIAVPHALPTHSSNWWS